MNKKYDASHGQNNPAFVGDDGKIFVPALELELSEKKSPKDDGDYDPYLHRNVEHPTTYEQSLKIVFVEKLKWQSFLFAEIPTL